MPIFTIERGQLHLSEEESEKAALRALLCSMGFPGMRWLRSFQDETDKTTRCFYVAHSAAEIRYHSTAARIACQAIRPVTEMRPDGSAGIVLGGADQGRDPEAVDEALLTWVVRQQLDGRRDEDVAWAPWVHKAGEAGWLRTFIDREVDELFTVFCDYTREAVQRRAESCGFRTIEVRQMIQALPADVVAAAGLWHSDYGAVHA